MISPYHMAEWEKDVLVLAALMPPPISLDHLVGMSNAGPIAMLRLMERLTESGILSVHGELGKGYYYFTDVRDVDRILSNLPADSLRASAELLRDFFSGELARGPKRDLALAHLADVGSASVADAEAVLHAAQYCLDRGLREDAAGYFRVVFSALEKPRLNASDKRTFIDACLGLVKAEGHLMPLTDQKSILEKAFRFASRLGDLDRRARLALVYAQILKTEGNYRKAARYFEEGWNSAQTLGNDELLKLAALSTTEFLFWQGRVADAVQRYEQVIGNLEELPSDETTLKACASLGWCYGICGETARGIGLIEAVRDRAQKLGLKELKNYANLMTVLTLLEARRLREAEGYLRELLSLPEEVLGHYILWAANASMAYVLYHHGDLAGCYNYQHAAYEHSEQHGWPHHRGPWNFEYLDGLEKAGIVHPAMNYDSEIIRVLNWPDTYMQGVGLRYRAQRDLERHGPSAEVFADLERSRELLTQAGAKIELARTQVLIGRELLREKRHEEAGTLLEEAWKVLSAVNEAAFPHDLRAYVGREDRERLLIKTIVDVGSTLGTIRTRNELLQRIITLTMHLTRAERGGFFLATGNGELELAATRNLDPGLVQSSDFQDNLNMIRAVARTGEEVIDREATESDNVGGRETRTGWLICSPVILQERVLGVLYLDSHLIAPAFPDEDLPLIKAIGSQVAVALDNARAYEEIAQLRDRLEQETRLYRTEMESSTPIGEILGESDATKRIRNQIEKVAETDSSVLITGETGVGKGLAAAAVHRLSRRAEGPFIPVNTASLAPELVASELFGHERGAFTGAVGRRLGRFELAHGGTLFLDDVDNLSPDIQARLLRALQEREFERVGGNQTIKSDFRIISATNQDPQKIVKEGRFRSDLYYRLNVFPIHIPPLRERREDIPLLAMHFLETFRTKMGKKIEGIPQSQMSRLSEYNWPGNVRELKHIIERAVVLSSGRTLTLPSLQAFSNPDVHRREFPSLEDAERSYIVKVLEACNWKVSGKNGAAEVLRVKPTTLYSKMRRLGIERTVSYRTR